MEPTNTFNRRGLDLGHYWRLFYKRRWLIVPLVLVSLVLGLIHVKRTRPLFQATARLLIEREGSEQAPFKDLLGEKQAGDSYQTQLRMLQSRSLARRALHTLELHNHPEFVPDTSPSGLQRTLRSLVSPVRAVTRWLSQLLGSEGATLAQQVGTPLAPAVAPDVVGDHLSRQINPTPSALTPDTALVKKFLSRIVVQPVAATQLINLSFQAHDPHLAAEVANTLSSLFIDQSLEMSFTAAQERLDWLNQRVIDMRQKVEAAELSMQRYKEDHNIFSLDDRLPGVMQELATLNASLTEARKARISQEILYKELQRAAGRPEMMEWMPAVVENRLIQSLKSSYVDLQQTFSQVSKKYGLEHPRG